MAVDLRELEVKRAEPTPIARRPVQIVSRYMVPGLILLGFLSLVGWSMRATFARRVPVRVVPVLASHSEVQQAGAVLFQAAGWVEPRPTPVHVAALAEGVVERLLVVEGQSVKAGEPIAQLVDIDARLSVTASEAEVALRQSELASARAALFAAEQTAANPVDLEAAVADARAMQAQIKTASDSLPFQIQAAEARVLLAQQSLEGKRQAGTAVSGRERQRAEGELAEANAKLAELRGRAANLSRELEALDKKLAAAEKRLELKIDVQRAVGEASAALGAAKARLDQAHVAAEIARLKLARMTIRSPIDGRVLALVAQPGSRVMGQATGESSIVVSLYNPAMLQVRADVRLENVPRVQLAQQVQIETEALREPVLGEVTSITSLADIQKNTLQVKVAIKSPPDVLRPDMLVRASFLAPKSTGNAQATATLRLYLPPSCALNDEIGSYVWLLDQSASVVHRRSVVVSPINSELVEITSGLRPGDKVVEGNHVDLKEGIGVVVTGEARTPEQANQVAPPGAGRTHQR